MSSSTPVVALHSSGASSRQWQALAGMLRPHHEVHALDLHGHGSHAAWPGPVPMRLADEAAPVERLLEQLGGAHLIGHSYGAAVALELASRRPALARSLVACEPVLFCLLIGDASSRREVQAVIVRAGAMHQHMAQGQPEAAARHFVDLWSGPGTWAALPTERQQGAAARMPAVMQQFGALPGAQHVTFAPMGHMGPVTHASLFNHRVAGFLQGLAARPDRKSRPSHPTLVRTAP